MQQEARTRFWESQFPKHAVVIALILLATSLRTPLLFAEGMHADEALFGTWANWIASGWDILLQNQVVDKPPVLFYLQAVALQLFDKADFALRMPNFLASLVLIGLAARSISAPTSSGGYKLQNDRSSLFPPAWESILFVLLLTLSPFMIQFSATGFTDPLMLCFGAAGLSLVGKKRFGWAGILLGLSIATKYTAIFLFPLLPLFTNQNSPSLPRRRESILFLKGLLAILLCLGCWLLLSGNGLMGTGDGQLIQGLRVVNSAELLPRFLTWNTYLHATFGYPFFLIMLPSAIFLHWNGTQRDRYLIAYTTLYFSFHWLIATALHDRYMLLLVWLSCWIVARSLALFSVELLRIFQTSKYSFMKRVSSLPQSWQALVLALTLIFMLPNALATRRDGYTTGRENFAAIGEAFSQAPYGTVIYDHFYSWQLRYQLFYERAYVEWVPHPDSLVDNLTVFYDEGRYIVLPATPVATRFHVALNEHGYTLQTLVQSDDVILYRIEKVVSDE